MKARSTKAICRSSSDLPGCRQVENVDVEHAPTVVDLDDRSAGDQVDVVDGQCQHHVGLDGHCRRTTAPSGGRCGRTAAHATRIDERKKSRISRRTSRVMDTGCRRPSTGTRGSGSSVMIAIAMTNPARMFAHETRPHSSTQTKVSHDTVHSRTPTSRRSPQPVRDLDVPGQPRKPARRPRRCSAT